MADSGSTTNGGADNVGSLIEIKGVVVDAVFPNKLPAIYSALRIKRPDGTELIAEVQQHLGDDRVRAVAMDTTDGLARGIDAVDTGAPISVPVGDITLGRVWNVLGDPVDGKDAPPAGTERWPIHRDPPAFDELSSKIEIFETGIKVVDLIAPYVRGGKIGLFGGAGVGKTVLIQELIATSPASTAASPCSPASASAPARATTCCSRWRSRACSTRSRSATGR